MAIFASTTLGSSDPQRAMTIKALEARAQALQAAQAKQEAPTSLPSPWQGVGTVMNTLADTMAIKRADAAAAQRHRDLAGYMANLGDNPTMAQIGPIYGADPEAGRAIMQEIQQRRSQATQIQAQKDAAAEAARVAETAAQAQEGRLAARPQSEGAKITAAERAGQTTPEQAEQERKKAFGPGAAERKLAAEEQSANIDLQASDSALDEAMRLLATGKVYSGGGATLKGGIGKYADISGYTDTESTKISQQYNQIMSSQVLPILNKLKGSMSNADREFAVNILNDPTATVEVKRQALTMLKAQVAAHLKQSNLNLQTSGSSAVQVQQPASAPTAPAAPIATGGGSALLEEARKAIAAGAPRDKVMQRLKEKGVDTTGL